MPDAYILGAWAHQGGKPPGSKDAEAGGHQDGAPEDQGQLHRKWEHHGQEGDHQAQVDQQKRYDAHQGQESHKHMMMKDNEEMRKRMDGHNHMTKHMMKKADVKAKVEAKKRKRKSSKVPLLMGLGLPVLRKRFLNSFQVAIMMIMMMTMPIQ